MNRTVFTGRSVPIQAVRYAIISVVLQVLAFTMMGIIVNAGSVLKYVSMVLLVFVYMHDCYNNVYENYVTFDKTIIDEMIDRTTEDLRKIASMPSSQQANAAFLVCSGTVFMSLYSQFSRVFRLIV